MGFTAPSGWNIWKMRFEKQSEGESDMKYYSTRDAAVRMDAAEAIKMGLSRDGGLLTPCGIPQIDRAFLESLVNVRYQERAAKVMGLYLTDYTYEELSGFAENAYGPEKFDCDAVAPVRTVDETTHCLELWHGPTSAFKDMALQMLPQLLSAALRKTGESKTVCILVATSGDTGKAAMEGFAPDQDPGVLPQGRRVQGPGDPDGHSGRRQCGRLRRGGQLRRRPGRCKAHFLR